MPRTVASALHSQCSMLAYLRVLGCSSLVVLAACTTSIEEPEAEGATESAIGGETCAEEAAPQSGPDCHPRERSTVQGAYFRKVSSESRADHTGIIGEGTLPKVFIDRSRWHSTPAELRGADAEPVKVFTFGPLDTPSVYMGGHAGTQEVDCGLSWSRVFLRDGRGTWTNDMTSGSDGGDPKRRFVVQPDGKVVDGAGVERKEGLTGLVENFAFRPYWRIAAWNNPSVKSADNRYFYPGTAFKMVVKVIGRDELEMRIEAGAADPAPFTTHFAAKGFGRGLPQSWKRVNSVDQFRVVNGKRDGLEGSPVLPTRTRVMDAAWKNVSLLGPNKCKLACGASVVVGADIASRYDTVFKLDGQTAEGGEQIDIDP